MRQFTTILFAFFTVIVFLSRAGSVYAAATPITGNNPLVVLTPSPSVSPVLTTPDTTATDNEWVPDQTVTFLGEAASRSAILLDWALVNYHWGYIETTIQTSWATTRNIVFALLILVVIIAAAVIIITGGANVTVLVFARKFIYIVLLITFSYAIVSLLYQIIDILQGFFLRKADGTVIAAKDIVQMSFSYSSIVGYRKLGATNFEAAFISELLIQLTVLTNYAMVIILTVRKIILWLFLVVSPIFPLTLLYFPIKNVSKRWLFEFFRWLLYAPLFALFLSALVTIWQNRINILPFNFFSPQPYIFPTAISILIGGPGQTLSLTNSVNYNDTFAEYIVALLMLWMVILLPFILLQLFLDFLSNNSLSTQQMTSFITNNLKGPLAKREIPIPFIGTNPFRPTPPPPPGSQPAGVARALPLSLEEKRQQTEENMKKIEEKREQSASNIQSVMNTNRIGEKTIRGTKIVTQRPVETQAGRTTSQNEETQRIVRSNIATTHVTQTQSLASTLRSQLRLKPQVQESQSLRLVSFPIPTMQDIVKYETARLKKGAITTHEMTNVRDTLQKIATPQVTSSPVEKQKYTTLKTKLTEQKTQGDVVASSILQAASVVSQTQTATGGGPSLVYPVNLPPVNPIQTVSLDDYEAVKAMWVDNYQKVDVPQLSDTQPQTRQEWIQHDINTISETISLLTSPDPQKIQQGLNEVSQILPFILMGGFSQTEVVAYLKAKLEAGKMVGELLTQKEAEDEKLIDVQNQHHEKLKTMEASAQEAIDGDETT